jgi:WS/DGAT/MGAT family acyltransferase
MARHNYERLSAQDHTFLILERRNVHMHVAATAIYEAGSLKTPEGGIDIDRFKRGTEAVMHLIPRYRQKLKWIPLFGQPVWVDDRHFELDYHIRHTALPRPGNPEQLKKLAARIMSQQLDRSKPLWEFWVVEGLQGGDRFAVISKIHHCMIDGSSGVDLATVMMSFAPDDRVAETVPYMPRPSPRWYELVRDEATRRMMMPLVALQGAREAVRQANDMRAEIGVRMRALTELLGYAIRSPSDTPMNGRISPQRRFDWLMMPLDDVKTVRRAFDCTVNDVVLATVAGAVRGYLLRRRVDPADVDFRISAPVSVRAEEDRGKLGNKVSSWILSLPVDEADPVKRLEAIRTDTRRLKESHQALGVQMLLAAAEWAPAQLLSLGSQASAGPINMIVTNVPGPQFPLYMLGTRLLEMYPKVPLLENTGLGVALFSYDGRVFWGFNADPALIPDLAAFVSLVKSSFGELRDRSRLRIAEPAKADGAPRPSAGEPNADVKSEEDGDPAATKGVA